MSDPIQPTSGESASPDPSEEATPKLGWAPKDDRSFWSRVKSALGGEPGPAAMGETAPDVPMLPPVTTPKPRKVRKTAFDRAREARAAKDPSNATTAKSRRESDSRRTRLRRAAEEKRDGLALVVGEKIEKVLVEKLEGARDEGFRNVARGFVELSGVLGGLGRQLGSQEQHARAIEEKLAGLPESERAQAEALAGIARAIGDQTGTQGKVAQSLEGVPEIVSLVKQGSGTVQGQLQALGDMHRELVLQREQRERVVDGVHRVERALLGLGEQLQGCVARQTSMQNEVRARTEESVTRLERSLGAVAARLDLAAREEEDRARLDRSATADQAERLERALAVMAARVHEQSVAIVGSQEEAATTFRRAQESVAQGFEEAQERTIATLERLHEERVRELAKTRRRTNLMAAVCGTACLGLLGLFGATLVTAERDRAQAELAAERARTESAVEVARTRAEAMTLLASTATAASGSVATATSGSVQVAVVAPVGSTAGSTTLPAGFEKR